MDAISYSYADKAHKRIKKIINDPDSTSGVVTIPSTIASGETITIPAGRTAILPNVQIDGTLNVDGTVFIPTGSKMSQVIPRVTSTDNAVVRFDGTTGAVQNSSVIIDDNGNVGIGKPIPIAKFHVQGNIRIGCSGVDAVNTRGIIFDIDDAIHGRLAVDNSGNLLYIGNVLGYGTGSGGTVTQPSTNGKSTSVTLNKPSGEITMNNAALAAGASVEFIFNNNLLTGSDILYVQNQTSSLYYNVWARTTTNAAVITVKNISYATLSEALVLEFAILKGANS